MRTEIQQPVLVITDASNRDETDAEKCLLVCVNDESRAMLEAQTYQRVLFVEDNWFHEPLIPLGRS